MATTRALVPRGLPRPPPRTRARRRVPALRRAAPRDACAPEEPHLEDVLSSSGRTTDMARSLWAAALRVGDVAIDATAGNGHDTVALARLVARDDADAAGRVVAYDVQASAVASARARVTRELPPATAARVELRHASHDTMAADVPTPDSVGVVCFNLGYLPGADSDKSVTTTTDATVRAVTTATGLLREGGRRDGRRVRRARRRRGGNGRGVGVLCDPRSETVRRESSRGVEPEEQPAARRGASKDEPRVTRAGGRGFGRGASARPRPRARAMTRAALELRAQNRTPRGGRERDKQPPTHSEHAFLPSFLSFPFSLGRFRPATTKRLPLIAFFSPPQRRGRRRVE